MAYREVTVLEVKEVVRQWLGGASKKRIAARLRLDVKTVRRYVAAAEEEGLHRESPPADLDLAVAQVVAAIQAPGRPRGDGWATCEAERGFIANKLDKGVRLSKVHRLLRRRGVLVTYATLHRFAVTELDFGRGAPTIPVSDGPPGAEVQVDTGWVGSLEPDERGVRRRFRAWIFTAVLSRHRFVYPVRQETTESAIEACEAAWSYFGGVFATVIPDNTKAIVIEADPLYPRLSRAFLEYSQARGFVIDATRVRTPTDKARVERTVRTVSEDCFGGEVLRTIEEARERGVRWARDEYGMRRHRTTLRLPYEHFVTEELPVLQRQRPAPAGPYEVPLWCEPKVHRDQHAQVAKALYSLPRTLLGKTLLARADRTTVRFYYREELVKTHPRMAPGQRSTDPHDFPADKAAVARRDTAFLLRKAEEHGAAVAAYAQALLDVPLPWTRVRQVYALLGLAQRYGDERLDKACQIALAADMVNVMRLRRMLDVVPSPDTAAPKPPNVVPFARHLRPSQQYALPLPSREAKLEGE